jgi:DNA-binding XRE family transcriptional regulator/biotin operon repressor
MTRILTDSLYLNTLPAHPQPQALESLSSYLKRLAKANGIHHLAAFSHLVRIRKPARLFELSPPLDWGQLGQLTQTTEAQLLILTPYFLGHKLGREQTMGKFLAKSVVQHLRWCPHCLAEQGYYKLPWSFLRIPGCPQHGIKFLDACPHCQQKISLKSSLWAPDSCPHCDTDLGQSTMSLLTDAELQTCQAYWDDLVYLLTPQDWQLNPATQVAAAMRQRLGYIRRSHNLKAQQLAQILGLSKRVLGALENETQSGVGETLADYLRYADYFGLTLSDVFRESAEAGYIHKDDLYATEMLQQVQTAIQQLKETGIPVTRDQIGEQLGHTRGTFRKYPLVHDLLRIEAQIRDKRTPEHEDEMCQQIQQVIQRLNAKRERVTKRKVGLLVGYDPTQIQNFYPRAYRILTDAVTAYQHQKPLLEARLLQQVGQALVAFRKRGDAITQKAIAQHLGISESQLAGYSEACARIAEQQQQMHEAWLGTLKRRIADEMKILTAQNIFVSRGKLAQRLAIGDHRFEQYPELMAMWRAFDKAQRLRHESELVSRTQAAIFACQAEQIPLTFRKVAERVGMERVSLKRYPRVLAVLQAHHLVRTETVADEQ